MNSAERANHLATFKKIFGMEPRVVTEFSNPKGETTSFKAYSEALKHANQWRMNCGSMCGSEPIGLATADHDFIAKWRNIRPSDYSKLSGIMVSDSFRSGDVLVMLK